MKKKNGGKNVGTGGFEPPALAQERHALASLAP